jgi:hypothetical protein
MPKEYEITGKVTDPNATGLSVAGLRIEVWALGAAGDTKIADSGDSSVYTDAGGSFVFDATRSIEAHLKASGQPPDIYFQAFQQDEPTQPVAHTRATPLRGARTKDPRLGDVVLVLGSLGTGTAPAPASSARRAARGASAPGARTATTTPPLPANPSARVQPQALAHTGIIEGFVKYSTDGGAITTGLEGVEIAARRLNEIAQPGLLPQITDYTGHFAFTSLARGWFEISLPPMIELADLANAPQALTDLGITRLKLGETDSATFLVALDADDDSFTLPDKVYSPVGPTLSGSILLKTPGAASATRPLPRVQVTLHQLKPPGRFFEEFTNVGGGYAFGDLEDGVEYRLSIDATLDASRVGAGKGSLRLDSPLPPTILVRQGIDVPIGPISYIAVGGDIRGAIFVDKDVNRRRLGVEPGLDGIAVTLVYPDGATEEQTTTQQGGQYSFVSRPAGVYTLRFPSLFTTANEEYSLTTPESVHVEIRTGATATPPDTGYQPEPHEIVGRVVYENGTGIGGLRVELLDASGLTVLDTTVSAKDGSYRFGDVRGAFKLRFPRDPLADDLLSVETQDVQVNSTAFAKDTMYRLPGGRRAGGQGGATNGQEQLTDVISDIAAYMPTSQEVGGPVARSYGTNGAGGDLQQIVDTQLAAVLGGRVKLDATSKPDAASFVENLTRAFPATEVDGTPQYRHVPRMYAVQTELGGAITGAQASLYRRAKVALDDALPLLDGLSPLDPAADSEETAAVRAIVRTEFIELVNEFGREGGPRVQRVDELFRTLGEHIVELGEELGIDPENIVTVDEEQRATNFEVVSDYIDGLLQTWQENRARLGGVGTQALGTQLVRLSRALNSVAEGVLEVYQVMDAVRLGPGERQTVLITFPPASGESPLFVEDLLAWVARFAGEEGPALVRDGGRRGVLAIRPVAERLHTLLEAAARAEVEHVAFSRVRVRRALSELAGQLRLVAQLAARVTGAPS